MQAAINFASMMSQGVATVPKHLQGSQSDCLAVTMQAMQWGMNPFAVAQKTHLVSGALGYEAQLVNAVISTSTAIEGRFHYEYGGDWKNDKDPTAWVKVGATLRGEEKIQWGEPLYPAVVTTKNSPLWKTAPKQQASYLALKYWARLYTPAVIMGVYTSDEIQDMDREERDITPGRPESALRRPAEDVPVELIPVDELIESMQGVTTLEDLDQIRGEGESHPHGDDWNRMAAAYKKRKAEILRAQEGLE
jgi:hypothetical protein